MDQCKVNHSFCILSFFVCGYVTKAHNSYKQDTLAHISMNIPTLQKLIKCPHKQMKSPKKSVGPTIFQRKPLHDEISFILFVSLLKKCKTSSSKYNLPTLSFKPYFPY